MVSSKIMFMQSKWGIKHAQTIDQSIKKNMQLLVDNLDCPMQPQFTFQDMHTWPFSSHPILLTLSLVFFILLINTLSHFFVVIESIDLYGTPQINVDPKWNEACILHMLFLFQVSFSKPCTTTNSSFFEEKVFSKWYVGQSNHYNLLAPTVKCNLR